MTQLIAIDLFAGAGGLSRGLENTGFTVISAIERDPQAASTYRLNHPKTRLFDRDITAVTQQELVGKTRRRIDLIAGGPPCQGFSMKGQRRPDHPGNAMLDYFLAHVREIKPRAILIENVVGLTSLMSGYYFDRLITGLERIALRSGKRYDVEFGILDASEYGLPQRRRRLFVVAVEPPLKFAWPTATSRPGDLTLWHAISDLPEDSLEPGELARYSHSSAASVNSRVG